MPRLLLTGGTGQVGSAIRAVGAGLGWDIDAPTRAELDLGRPVDLVDRVAAATVVINAGAYTKVDQAETDREEAFAANRDGPALLAAACGRAERPMIHLSTDYVFDGAGDRPYREDDPTAPMGVYGASKEAGERAVRTALPAHVILRTSWVFSATGHNFLKTMVRLAAERDEVSVVADQRGCPTEADDIARTCLAFAERMTGAAAFAGTGTFHFSGAPATTWHGFAAEIFRQLSARGRKVPSLRAIATADWPTPVRRPAYSVLDCTRVANVLGVAPPDWRDGVARCLDRLLDDGR